MGHDGYNNGFHAQSKSPLFQIFGAAGVQEKYHAAQTIKMLKMHENDFFPRSLTRHAKRVVHKRILMSILNTDMAQHNDLHVKMEAHLAKMGIENGENSSKFIDKSSSETQEESKQLLSSYLLHAADISTSCRKFDTSKIWADNLFDEFFNQGDYERSHNMPISFLCDRNSTNIPAGQPFFIETFVMPVFRTLA